MTDSVAIGGVAIGSYLSEIHWLIVLAGSTVTRALTARVARWASLRAHRD
jgi:hypothetical protein